MSTYELVVEVDSTRPTDGPHNVVDVARTELQLRDSSNLFAPSRVFHTKLLSTSDSQNEQVLLCVDISDEAEELFEESLVSIDCVHSWKSQT